MKKILFMFAMLMACSIASAQTDTTTLRSKTTEKNKTAVKKTKKADRVKQPEEKAPRANGTVGTIDFPDTQGAGTGTGNDSRKNPPPGQPEKTEQ